MIAKLNVKSEKLGVDTRTGFSLVEVLIYSAILALFLGASLVVFNSILTGVKRFQAQNEVTANLEFLVQKLNWAINQASGINNPGPNSTSTTVSLNQFTSSTSPAVFGLSNGQITLTLASSSAVALNNNRVTVSQFSAHNFSSSTATSTIRINIAIQSKEIANVSSSVILGFTLP